jgi:hypothetical protein
LRRLTFEPEHDMFRESVARFVAAEVGGVTALTTASISIDYAVWMLAQAAPAEPRC